MASETREIGVGLLGLGNVGSGVVKLLAENAAAVEQRLGARVVVRKIAVRAAETRRLVDVDPKLITVDANQVIDDPSVEIVVELVGGEKQAHDYVMRAIKNKKHVVTANKALLATRGAEIFSLAEKNDVDVYFEAAVCGGVPIIRALREGLASDRIQELRGIVNGTSNFILTAMTDEGRPFDEILKDAQEAGYAEADPSLDVDGFDAAHKLAVLCLVAFGAKVKFEDIYVEGLRGLAPVDFEYAKKFGYVIKPLVIGKAHDDGIEARVHPAMVPERWLLSSVSGVNNAVYVSSAALGNSMYYGRGAGMMATAVAVVSDVFEVSKNLLAHASGARPVRGLPAQKPLPIRDIGKLSTRYYLRFAVLDQPGVLAQIARLLADHEISIAQVVQEGKRSPDKPTTVVILTHEARESNVRLALAQADKLATIVEKTRLLRIAE
jgi:homoserine dehydrogenase